MQQETTITLFQSPKRSLFQKHDKNTGNRLNRRRMVLLCVLPWMILYCMSARSAHAADLIIREIISVHPEENQTRGFVVNDKFSLLDLSSVEGFIVYSWGYNAPAGDMDIKLVCLADTAYSQRIGFSLIVGGYSLNQSPVVRWKRALFPATIAETVPVQSTFGVYYIGVFVNYLIRTVDLPIPFAITFSVSKGSAQ